MVNEQALDRGLRALSAARLWSLRLIAKLEDHIRSTADEALFRINPLTFARDNDLPAAEAVDLFLHATACGLFRMDWLVLCPHCSCVVESLVSLRGVHNRFQCHICQSEYEAVLDDFIAVTFTVSPEVRDIAFHHPERLSPRDRFFKIGGTRDGRMPDGTPFVDLQAAATRAVVDLAPDSVTNIDIDVTEGTVLGASLEGRAATLCPIEGSPTGQCQRFDIEFGETVRNPAVRRVAPGAMTFAIHNATSVRGTFWLAVLPADLENVHAPIEFVPFLSGKRLLTTQTFRELFRSEVVRTSEGIGIRDLTLLFTDLKGSTALYREIGDLNAFALVQQHFHLIQEVTARHGGAVVKTMGDAVMAVFPEPMAAVRAAVDMLHDMPNLDQMSRGEDLVMKAGIHRGAAIAVTLDDRLDYFGQTVNIAARVQALAGPNEICLTGDVHGAAGVAELLERSFRVETSLVSFRGMHEEMPIYSVTQMPAGPEQHHQTNFMRPHQPPCREPV